jgi:DNA-binding NtrC family response regulator
LARSFRGAAAKREGRPARWLERSAERQLLEYSWPGNVRELEALLGQALLASESPAIHAFPDRGLDDGGAPLCLPWPETGTLEVMMKAVAHQAEGALLRRALDAARGEPARAAETLGLTLRTLAQRLREHGIPLEDIGSGEPSGPADAERMPPRKAP